MYKTQTIILLVSCLLMAYDQWDTFEYGKKGILGSGSFYNGSFWSISMKNGKRFVEFDRDTVIEHGDNLLDEMWGKASVFQGDSLIWFCHNVEDSDLFYSYNYRTGVSIEYHGGHQLNRIKGVTSTGVKIFDSDTGIVAFDGVNTTLYDSSNSTLDSGFTSDFYFDSSGNTYVTWLMHYDKWYGEWGGVSVFDGENWDFYDSSNSGLPHNYIYNIHVDTNNDKWFATHQGLARLSDTGWTVWDTLGLDTMKSNIAKQVFHSDDVYIAGDSSYFRWNGKQFETIDFREMLTKYGWFRPNFTSDRFVWGEVSYYDKGVGGLIHTVDTGVVHYTSGNVPVCKYYHPQVFGDAQIRTIEENGTVWISPSTAQWFTPTHDSSRVNYSGLVKYEPHLDKWTEYTPYTTNIANDTVTALTTAPDGAVYIANHYGISVNRSGDWFGVQDRLDVGIHPVTTMAVDCTGVLWAGSTISSAKALGRYDGATWERFTTSDSPLPSGEIYDLAVDTHNVLWVGHREGLSSFDGTRWQSWTTSDGLPHNIVRGIATASDGTLWGATQKGAFSFDGTTFTVLDSAHSALPSNYLFDIAIDTAGELWYSSLYSGVVHWDGSTWESHTIFGTHLIKDVRSVTADPFGNVWVPTNHGAFKWNGSEWITYDTSTSDLQSNEIGSIAIARDGSKWFGTKFNGVAHLVDDDTLTVNTIAAIPQVASQNLAIQNHRDQIRLTGLVPGSAELVCFDLRGRELWRQSVVSSGTTATVSLPSLAQGVVLLRAVQGDRAVTAKVVR